MDGPSSGTYIVVHAGCVSGPTGYHGGRLPRRQATPETQKEVSVLEPQREVLEVGHLPGDLVRAHAPEVADKAGGGYGIADHNDAVRCVRIVQGIGKAGQYY